MWSCKIPIEGRKVTKKCRGPTRERECRASKFKLRVVTVGYCSNPHHQKNCKGHMAHWKNVTFPFHVCFLFTEAQFFSYKRVASFFYALTKLNLRLCKLNWIEFVDQEKKTRIIFIQVTKAFFKFWDCKNLLRLLFKKISFSFKHEEIHCLHLQLSQYFFFFFI